jgi:hypothetical protein
MQQSTPRKSHGFFFMNAQAEPIIAEFPPARKRRQPTRRRKRHVATYGAFAS